MYRFEIEKVGRGYLGVLFKDDKKIWTSRAVSPLHSAIVSVRQKSYKLKGVEFTLPDFDLIRSNHPKPNKLNPVNWDNVCYTLTPAEYYKRLKAEGRSIKNLK